MSTLYEKTRQRHIEYLLTRFAEHFERVGWSAERLREERTARLLELIRIAVERSSTLVSVINPATASVQTTEAPTNTRSRNRQATTPARTRFKSAGI